MAQGISLGFLLLMAVLMAKADTGNPFTLIGTALVATIFTGVGPAFCEAAEAREFSLLHAGLLYQLNAVIHSFTPDKEMEGAYIITIGVLVLFGNILSLLMRLRRW